MACSTYIHNDPTGGSKYVSGTTCTGAVVNYTLTFGQSVCMDDYLPLTLENGLTNLGECIGVTPTPTPSPVTYCITSGKTFNSVDYYCGFNGVTYQNVYGNITLSVPGSQHPDYSITLTNGVDFSIVSIPNGQTFTEYVYPQVIYSTGNGVCDMQNFNDWYIYTANTSICAPIPPTPSITPSITPTHTPTPSATPTFNYYGQIYVFDYPNFSIPTPPLSAFTMTYNGQTFNQSVGDFGYNAFCSVGPIPYGTTGDVYSFSATIIDNSYVFSGCPAGGGCSPNEKQWDRIDITLTDFIGETVPNYFDWYCTTRWYYQGTLVYTLSGDSLIFIKDSLSNIGSCPPTYLFGCQSLYWSFTTAPSPSPSPSPTSTPTPTPTSLPTYYYKVQLYDCNTCTTIGGTSLAITNTLLTINDYYAFQSIPNRKYLILQLETPGSFAVDFRNPGSVSNNSDCALLTCF